MSELVRSIQEGDIHFVKELLWQGADPNHCDKEGYTALSLALREGHMDVAKFLVLRGVTK